MKKILSLIMLLLISYPIQSADDYFYNNPYKIMFTTAATVGLSKLFYDAAPVPFSFMNALLQKLFIKSPIKKEINQIPIALIRIHGEIFSTDSYLHYFEQVKNDRNIKGVLIEIESPGGSAGASQLLYRELKKVSAIKPVVVFTAISCCSGGYHIASASNWIIASDLAQVGSIGTLLPTRHFTDKIKGRIDGNEGRIKFNFIKAGKFKLVGNPYQELSPEDEHYLQEGCDEVYKLFCNIIAQERSLNLDEKEMWAEGKSFIAQQALELGLIDQLGGWTDAKDKIKELVSTKYPKVSGKIQLIKMNETENQPVNYDGFEAITGCYI